MGTQPQLFNVAPPGNGPPSTQIWSGVPRSPILINNLSLTTTAYIGYTPQITPTGLNVTVLAPGQSMQFDGSRSLWAVSLASVTLNIIPNALAVGSAVVGINIAITAAGAVITAPGGTTITNFTVPNNAEGYQLTALATTAPNTAIYDLTINHRDIFGDILFTEHLTSSFLGTAPPLVQGKVYGAFLQIIVTNSTSVFMNAVTAGLFPTATPIQINAWFLSDYDGTIGKRPAGTDLLCDYVNIAFPASTEQAAAPITDFTGMLDIMSYTVTANVSFYPEVRGYTVAGGTGAMFIYRGKVTAINASNNDQMWAPSEFLMLWINNTTAVAGHIETAITAGATRG